MLISNISKFKNKSFKKMLSIFLTISMVTTLFAAIPLSVFATSPNAGINGDWNAKNVIIRDTTEAQLMVRSGDIDNFGFGWATSGQDFNPFSGKNTVTHTFPWSTPSDEPQGLDKIMVVSGYNYNFDYKTTGNNRDGYTEKTTRNANDVKSVNLNYINELSGINIRSAVLQMFVDDIQPGNTRGVSNGTVQYTVKINNVVIPELGNVINSLQQGGPIGNLVNFQIPDRYLYLVESGNISMKIDDERTGRTGDGYAIDFVKLLINFKAFASTATVEGYVKDNNNRRLEDTTVTAGGIVTTKTDANGYYRLNGVPAGQAIITATKPGYMSQSLTIPQIVAGGGYKDKNFRLAAIAKLGIPTITQNPATITSQDVLVAINYPGNPTIQEYKIGEDGLWKSYTGPITINENTVIKARGKAIYESYENLSDIAEHRVTNIDKIKPLITIKTPVMGDDKVDIEEQKNVIIRGSTEPNAIVTVVIKDKNNKSVNNLIATSGDTSGNYTVSNLDVSGLVEGELTIIATAEDAVGNSSQATTKIQKYDIAPEVNIKVSDVTGIKDTYEATAQNFNKSVNKILNPNITLRGEAFANINVKAKDVDFFKYQFIPSSEAPQTMPEDRWQNIDLSQETINEDVILEQKGHLNQRAYEVSHMPLLSNETEWSNAEKVFKTPFDATTYKASTYSLDKDQYGKDEDYLKSDGTKSKRWVTNSMFMSNMSIGGDYKEASKFWGYIKVPTNGNYSFGALSDDGCRGYITVDGETKPFVNMFKPQGSTFGTTDNVYNLKSNKYYPIYLEYFNWGGSANFELRHSDNGSVTSSSLRIPADWFYPSKNITPGEYATTIFTGNKGVKFPEQSNDYYIAFRTGKGDKVTREGFYGPFTVNGKTPLNLSKVVIGGNTVEEKGNFILEYTIQPGDIVPRSTFKNLDGTFKDKIYLNSVKLQDGYPQNIEMKYDANDSKIVKNGQKVTVQIPNIEYNLVIKDGKSIYVAEPVKIKITLSAKVIGNYNLSAKGESIITFEDVNGANAQTEFSPIGIIVIDTIPPVITLGEYITTPTNRDITVTATTNEGTLNVATHKFTENGTFDFVSTDVSGNVTTKTVTITNINKVLPVITINPYTITQTNKDIVVIATTDKGTLNTSNHIFNKNGSFNFVATDSYGNVATRTITVSNIDKIAPTVTLRPSTTAPTNNNVTVVVNATDNVSIATTKWASGTQIASYFTTGGTVLRGTTFPVTVNGVYTVYATDTAGNDVIQTITVSNIVKVAPVITINPYIKTQTNQDIVVTATTDKGTLNTSTHIFTENGSFDFVATDSYGNITTRTITISNIDKVAPATPTLMATLTTLTKENVTVTITYPNDANIKEYKIGTSGKWLPYIGPVVVDTNCTIYAKCQDEAGNTSREGLIVVNNIDNSIIKTGLFINNQFKEQKNDISIVKGFHTNLAFDITNFKNQKVTLEMNNINFINISKVEVYSITNLKNPIETLNISGNTITINLPTDETHFVLVFKATALNLGTNINDVIKINGFERIEKHTINILKLPPLQ